MFRALATPRFALVASLLLCAVSARAGDEPQKDEPPDTPHSKPEKRPVPDYDGRRGPRESPARKALWVPRVLLFPAYVVSEYLVRRPLGFAITAAERSGLPAAVYDFLDLGSSHPIGVVPFMLIDFGFEPSVGLYAYWDNAGFEGHDLRLRGSTWGPSWLSGTATERFRLGDLELALTGTATRRPDYTFYGLGPDTREADLVRYSGDTVYARFESRLAFKGRSALETSVGYRGASYGHSDYDIDDRNTSHYERSLDEAVAASELADPAGFRDGFRAPFGQARLMLDSRGRSQGRNGIRLDLLVEQSADLKSTPASGWRRYGGTLWGFVDLLDGGRVLSLSVTGIMVDPLGARPVPFTQLASLGGGRTMPGLRTGRLYDRSALVTNLRYAWPIWLALNGSLQAGLGNVFGAHFEGFRPERTRLSLAIGLETGGSRDSVFQALVGFGTETFESGAELDTIRAVLGVRNGF
ncbi:MAG TPA: hypothetical protein VJN18_08885 [Polyangiaceae bacterium]|nr:hypothetical protein [Polyangiaceae bacterium]